MKIEKTIVVNVPAARVWDILGHNFARIGDWDASVSRSVVRDDIPKLEGAPYAGRVCETVLGTISERFTTFDDHGMTYSFQGDISTPVFTNAINTVTVKAIDEHTTRVTTGPDVDLTWFGTAISPLVWLHVGSVIQKGLEDLKYFAETGNISPRQDSMTYRSLRSPATSVVT